MDKSNNSTEPNLQDSWVYVDYMSAGQGEVNSDERYGGHVENVQNEELGNEQENDSESDGICVIAEDDYENLQCSICSCENEEIQEVIETVSSIKENTEERSLSTLQQCYLNKIGQILKLSENRIIYMSGLVFFVAYILYTKHVSDYASIYTNSFQAVPKKTLHHKYISINEMLFKNCTEFCTSSLPGQRLSCKSCSTKANMRENYCNVTAGESYLEPQKTCPNTDFNEKHQEKEPLQTNTDKNQYETKTQENRFSNDKTRKNKHFNKNIKLENKKREKGVRKNLEYLIKELNTLYKKIHKRKVLKYLKKSLRHLLNKVENRLEKDDDEHRSDWLFQRARLRHELRNKPNWFIVRGTARENIRRWN